MNDHAPDVVYPLKKKSQYEELKYSLRSLQNVPHGRVFIAGVELPKWAKNVIHVPVQRQKGETHYQNAERNWLAACEHPDLADEFIAMNDDMYFLKPIDHLPYYHDGELIGYMNYRKQLGDTHENYLQGMQQTIKLLQERGIDKPLGYTLHIPMRMNKEKRIKLHKMFEFEISNAQLLLLKTLYGNIFDVGGEQRIDVKFVNDRFNADETYISTNDAVFKYEKLGELIRARFPNKSQYEL